MQNNNNNKVNGTLFDIALYESEINFLCENDVACFEGFKILMRNILFLFFVASHTDNGCGESSTE